MYFHWFLLYNTALYLGLEKMKMRCLSKASVMFLCYHFFFQSPSIPELSDVQHDTTSVPHTLRYILKFQAQVHLHCTTWCTEVYYTLTLHEAQNFENTLREIHV